MTSYDASRSGITWAVKESLIRYVMSSEGEIFVNSPATTSAGGFSWTADSISEEHESNNLTMTLAGGVSIQAHGGLMSLPLEKLAVSVSGQTARLTSGASPTGSDLTIVTGDVRQAESETDAFLWVVDKPRLHEDVVDWFGGQYNAGTVFAPMIIVCTPNNPDATI